MDASAYSVCPECQRVFKAKWYLDTHLQIDHCDDHSQKHLYRMVRYIESEPEEEQANYQAIGYINACGEFIPQLKRQNAVVCRLHAFDKEEFGKV